MAVARERDPFLSLMAALFALLALSNLTKAAQHAANPQTLGIVIFGVRFDGVGANLVLGALMGSVLAAYAYGCLRRTPWVGPLSIAYAFYVPLNLVLFWWRQIGPDVPPLGSILVYLFFALGGSIGTALYLAYHRDLWAARA